MEGIKSKLRIRAHAIPKAAKTPTCFAGTMMCINKQSIPAMVVIPVKMMGVLRLSNVSKNLSSSIM